MGASETHVAKLREDLRNWLRDRRWAQVMSAGATAQVEASLSSRPKNPVFRFNPTAMMQLSCWYGACGTAELLDGKRGGWGLLGRSLLYQHWELRIVTRLYDVDPRPDKPPRVAAHAAARALAHALAVGDLQVAHWTGARMLKAQHDGAFHSWDATPLNALVLWLYGRLAGHPPLPFQSHAPGQSVSSLGVYEGVARVWDDPVRLADELRGACDYHCAHTSDEELNEFVIQPYPVFPAEILGVLRVREVLGAAVPRVEHPLLAGPFMEPPPAASAQADPLTEKVANAARQILPGL